MYPSCCIQHIAFALFILLDIVRTNGICAGSQNDTAVSADFRWTFIPKPIISCNGEDAKFEWGYQFERYKVGARTWFRGTGKNAHRIAHWNQARGFVSEDEFKNRVERIGEDGLLLKSVTPNDNNVYTLEVRFPLSSDPSPMQNITLTVYEPPLEGCCRPAINRLRNGTGLKVDLHMQACGTQPLYLEWNNVPGTTANGTIVNFELAEVEGIFKVCLNGTAVQKCYKGRPESLCQEEYIEKRSATEEHNLTRVILVAVAGTAGVLMLVGAFILFLCKKNLIKYIRRGNGNNGDEERQLLIERDQKLNRAMEKVANILYVTYKTCQELALDEISKIQLENTDLNFDNTIQHNPTYEQCLCYNGEPRRLLIVKGDLGSGKTSWCRKLVKTWCKSFECRQITRIDESDQNQKQDTKILESFPLLFFVSLRDVETGQSVTDIIQRQCLKNGQLGEDLELLIEKRHEKIIFLIHGADEAKENIHILKNFFDFGSLKIVTCHDWERIESRYNIQSDRIQPMACITLKKIDKENVEKYVKRIFTDFDYPQNAYEKFMELVDCNKLKPLMEEAFFVQPLIHIWYQYDTLPSDIAGVCLYFIQANLKKCRKKLNSYIGLNLHFDEVVKFIPRARGMIFIISHGKALKGLGKTAYHCLENTESADMFSEQELLTNTKKTDEWLAEICIAAKLVSAAPVGESRNKKRLRFRHPFIRDFMVAFYLACQPNSKEKDTRCKDNKFLQQLLTDLRKP